MVCSDEPSARPRPIRELLRKQRMDGIPAAAYKGRVRVSRLVVVSNRVAPIPEGERLGG